MDTATLDAHQPLTPLRALRNFADLPGPRGWPWVGNLLQVDAGRLHVQLEAWCAEFGPFFKVRLGPRPIIVVGDHEAVARALRDRPEGFRRTTRLEKIWTEMGLPPGVFGAHGEAWRRQRRMVMAGFDPAHVRRYFPQLQTVAQRLVARWHAAAQQGSAIDLQADLMRYTVDTIAGLAFGAEINTLQTDGDVIQQHMDKIFPALLERLLSPLPIWRWLRGPLQLPRDRQLAHSLRAVNAAVDGFVAQARRRMQADPGLHTRPNNLLEAMLAAAAAPDSGIDDTQVAGNVLTMLLAGEDTTANTLAWMLHLLWLHPAALARATEEVRRVIDNTTDNTTDSATDADNAGTVMPGIDQLAQLEFVEACAHETMRLKPVAPLLPLQALRDTVLGDVRVPEGTIVLNLMRRDSVADSHLPRAAAFEPERWLNANAAELGNGVANSSVSSAANSARRVSMPFGAGPRICPGRYLALLEMKMAMAVLLGRFDITDISTPDGLPAREHLAFTMVPVGLRMRLQIRS